MQLLTTTIAKYLFAVPFAIFGIFHFANGPGMANMVPFGGGSIISLIMVYLTGAGLLAATISMVIGKMDKLSTLLLGVMLALFALTIHLPGVLGGVEEVARQSMPALLKDLSLAGAAWLYSGYVAKDPAGMPKSA